MTTLNSTIRVPDEVLFQEIGKEAILLHQETGKYYGLDEVGTRMWFLLTEHGQLSPAYQVLLNEYEVAPEQLEHDLLTLVDNLASHDLLRIDPA
jgi:hypothetical protein